MTEESKIPQLCEQYKNYPGATVFIHAAFEVFKEERTKTVVSFIHRTFESNQLQDCSAVSFKKLSAHWMNISKDEVFKGNYQHHIWATVNSARYRCIGHFLENNPL